ncbi:MAG: twin-arginine translocase TatA/TatE family subunit [Moheibacter sp.]
MNWLTILPAFISFSEITVILLLSVVIFGPKKIPEIARGLGEGMRAMKKATEDIKREIMTPVDDINPVKDVQDAIQNSKTEIQDSILNTKSEIDETIDDTIGPIKRK